MNVKLKDIAAELNISVSTVSRVVNGKDRVDPDTRRRILDALKSHNYSPNEVARSLRLRVVKTIAIVVPDIANNFYASIIKGAQGVCREKGYSVIVCNSDGSKAQEQEVLYALSRQQVAGMILASVSTSSEHPHAFSERGFRVVFVDNIPPVTQSYDSVTINNVAAAHTLTRQLIERGYRKIGFITGDLEQSSGNERLSGYISALRDCDIPYEERRVTSGDFSMKSGYEAMRELLARDAGLDAVIVSNNFMTYGAMKAIAEAGLSVPGDIAVAAFDVVDESELIHPKITSINQPATEIGEQAAKILLRKLSAPEQGVHTNLLLDTVFSPGESW